MDPREPSFFEVVLVVLGTQFPEGRPKRPALFVDRQGMEAALDGRTELDVMEAASEEEVQDGPNEDAVRGSQRAHGIPDADELDLLVPPGVLFSEFQGLRAFRMPFWFAVLVMSIGLIDQVEVSPLQDAHVVNQPGDAACRVGSAAEAEEEYLIAGPVVAADELVGALDVVGDAVAEAAPAQSFRHAGSHSLEVIGDLWRAIAVAGAGRLEELGNIGRTGATIGRLLVRLIPGPVTENDELLVRLVLKTC